METRVEIFKDSLWVGLNLGNTKSVKFNALINKISEINSREISHSNTFKIPNTKGNIEALGLNIFNPKLMAESLNRKYRANYYIGDRLVQTGFVVINNVLGGNININFIDESLGLVEIWGTTTFKELLQSGDINRPADYQSVIDTMKVYSMDKTAVLQHLPLVGTRGHELALFPNTLNAIGSPWQLNIDEVRPDDSFNPYQSRPIYNVKALFDLATESFGFTPIYDDSVDWSSVKKHYIVNSGLGDDELEDGGLVSTTYSSTDFRFDYTANVSVATPKDTWDEAGYVDLSNHSPAISSEIPNNVSGLDIAAIESSRGSIVGDFSWAAKETLFKPTLNASGFGSLKFETSHAVNTVNPISSSVTNLIKWVFIWRDASGVGFLYESFGSLNLRQNAQFGPISTSVSGTPGVNWKTTVEFDKTRFLQPPAGGGDFFGVVLFQDFYYDVPTGSQTIADVPRYRSTLSAITEVSLPANTVSYDEFGQFIADDIDLTYAAPTVSIKQLLSAFMAKEGILTNINTKTKEVLYFSYQLYKKNRDDGKFSDWSQYLREYSPINRNTNYGNNYGQVNEVGLKEPYEGNTFNHSLSNIERGIKYKEFATNHNGLYSDVQGAYKIPYTNTPYIEFKNTRLGLVEDTGDLGDLTQVRYDKSTQGTITGLPHIQNVKFGALPIGMQEWYDIIDSSIKVEAFFLLPVSIFREVKLYEPIYVEQLGGYYIIEEISEYTDQSTPVQISLIKLLD